MNKYEFQVTGMSCAHCVSRVQAALKSLSEKVTVDLETGIATVETDQPAAEFLTAMEEAGYPGILRK